MKWPTNNFEWAVHGRAESTLRDNTTYQPHRLRSPGIIRFWITITFEGRINAKN